MTHDRDPFGLYEDVYEPARGSRPGSTPPSHAKAPQARAPRRPPRLWLHLLLMGLTFLSTTWTHALSSLRPTSARELLDGPLTRPESLVNGLTFAVTLMAILLAHELGHYFTARHYGVDQSLPYFIPTPLMFGGTLGAVILMRSEPPDRPVLLRVALAGPLAGLIVALPAAIWGLAHSPPVELELSGLPRWGASLLFFALERLFAPGSGDHLYHPVAMAAWVGLFVTAINLIPAAQLDGGHISYALFGRRHLSLSRFVVVMLFLVSALAGTLGPGIVWLVWGALLALLGLRHPPVRDESIPLSRAERNAGYCALVIFLLTFVPKPVDRVFSDERGAASVRELTPPAERRPHPPPHELPAPPRPRG